MWACSVCTVERCDFERGARKPAGDASCGELGVLLGDYSSDVNVHGFVVSSSSLGLSLQGLEFLL